MLVWQKTIMCIFCKYLFCNKYYKLTILDIPLYFILLKLMFFSIDSARNKRKHLRMTSGIARDLPMHALVCCQSVNMVAVIEISRNSWLMKTEGCLVNKRVIKNIQTRKCIQIPQQQLISCSLIHQHDNQCISRTITINYTGILVKHTHF